ncbi:MAG: hypothetical protein RLZZ628_2809, partial [Bacteroidota bacterium]
QILQIYTDFFGEFKLDFKPKIQKNPCKSVKSASSAFPFVS